MFVPFNSMPPGSRIWIYQANRQLASEEEELISRHGRDFLDQWEAHGVSLQAAMKIVHKHFIIIAVNETVQLPTGCSIDKSVELVRTLEQLLNINLFDRTITAFWEADQVILRTAQETKNDIQLGRINGESLVFDNLIQTRAELQDWIKPLKDTWLSKFIKQPAR